MCHILTPGMPVVTFRDISVFLCCCTCSSLFLSGSKFHTTMAQLKIEGQGFTKTITLNGGHKMPMFGLGFFLSEPEKVVDITVEALQNGYRLLDSAVIYG